jgi:hypothetical protein
MAALLVGHRIWMPGITAGTEWAAYYDDLVAEFGLTIEATGPNPVYPHSLLWAPRQPPPRPGCPARPPRRHEDRPRQPRHLDAELGVPDVGTG